jgi:hypothetical protein
MVVLVAFGCGDMPGTLDGGAAGGSTRDELLRVGADHAFVELRPQTRIQVRT